MSKITQILDSSVGQKVIAGATGLALVGFLAVHMAGNLQIFAGADALNEYAELLKSKALVLWGARLALLTLIVLHIAMTVRQRIRNRHLRSQRYAQANYQRTTAASRSMMLTGSLLLAFVIFHLLHFTVGAILPSAYQQLDGEGRHDVYAMVVAGFNNPLIVVIYIVGMLALAIHLMHAISSAWQTLGLVRDGNESKLRKLSPVLAAIIIAGFLAVPLSISFGLVGS
jgi:succinate dehydrogenase / fumarate reductase cytochrome b subunit